MFRDQYQVLYLFDNELTAIIEIKMKNIFTDDRSKIYRWFLYDKENDMLQPMVYKERKNENGNEFRVFEDALLIFDSQKAVYIKNNQNVNFKTIDSILPLNKKLKESVDDYLVFLKFRDNRF